MVGIFKYENGLTFYAAASDEKTAIKKLYDRYKEPAECCPDPMKWWEFGKKINNGAPRCFVIKEIEFLE